MHSDALQSDAYLNTFIFLLIHFCLGYSREKSSKKAYSSSKIDIEYEKSIELDIKGDLLESG